MSSAKAIARRIGRLLFGKYQLYRVYRLDRPTQPASLSADQSVVQLGNDEFAELSAHADHSVRKSVGFDGPGVTAYGLREQGRLASVAFFINREAYYSDSVWPLKPGEAALIELVTLPEQRGKGLAPLLIGHASADMFDRGSSRLYSWLWWTNQPSERAFQKAGWRYTAFSAQFHPFGRTKPIIWRRIVNSPSSTAVSENAEDRSA